ncbi:MAG: YceI family protein [Phycisphaerae bacterium]
MRKTVIRSAGVVLAAVTFPVLFAAAKAPANKLESQTFTVDSVHSMVMFKIRHMNVANFYGRFNELTGEFTLDAEDPSASKFEFTVNADSLDTANKNRDDHVKGNDLLNVANHPQITFKSTSVKSAGEDTYDVTGDLTFLGKTNSITVKIKKVGEGEGRGEVIAGLESKFEIKRSEYGMTQMIGPLSDEVTLMVSVEGKKK